MTASSKLQDILLDAPEVLTALLWPIVMAIVVLMVTSHLPSLPWILEAILDIVRACCYAVLFAAVFFILGP